MTRNLIFSLVVLIVGVIIFVGSRTLGTYEDKDEKWKEKFWLRQVISGPPGYRRAVGTLFGMLLIIVGVIEAFMILFSL